MNTIPPILNCREPQPPAPHPHCSGRVSLLALVLGGIGVLVTLLASGTALGAFLLSRSPKDPIQIAAAGDPQLGATLRSMRVAAATGDWRTFSRHIDVAGLRGSIVQLSRTGLEDQRRAGKMDGVESALADVFIGILLNEYLTEKNLPTLMNVFSGALAHFGDTESVPDPDIKRYVYFATAEIFVVAGESARTGKGCYIVFRKDPVAGWRLSGLTEQKP